MKMSSFPSEGRAASTAEQSPFPDSIYALSSGSLPAGVAVIRLSGADVRTGVMELIGELPSPRKAVLRAIRSSDSALIDKGLVLFFPAPHSFTGEDCAELHLHGGKAVIAAALEALSKLPRFRQAEAGEFTRRAFLNGKMDLTSAEALADLIAAETEAQRRLAIENAEGRQQRLYAGWRQRLLHARAMIEAELDFSDEGDIPGSVSESVWADMRLLETEIEKHQEGHRAAAIVRDGFRVVVAGAPNSGKSSLVNALARREVAIVTEIPGTTRDIVETVLDLSGHKVILSDTAGFRASEDMIEMIGVARARDAIAAADLVLHLVQPDGQPDEEILAAAINVRILASKADLGNRAGGSATFDHSISAVTGDGLDELIKDIAHAAEAAAGGMSGVLPTRLRHVRLLDEGRSHLRRAVEMMDGTDELRAEELRLAERALGRIIGVADVEDVLGEIFARFCIGK